MRAAVSERSPVLIVAVVLTALGMAIGAAAAQGMGGGMGGGKGMGGGHKGRGADDPNQMENAKKAKARESAYQDALKRIPDGKADNDPWKGAR